MGRLTGPATAPVPPKSTQPAESRPGAGRLRHLLDPRFEVAEESMSPSFQPGDRLRVDRQAYRAQPPNRGEVVIVRDPRNPHRQLLKRVVGVPGDRVYLVGERLSVLEPGAEEDRVLSEGENPGLTIVAWSLGGAVFVVGDNRRSSHDSRHFGPVPLGSILGRPVYRYSPKHRRGPI